MDESRHLDASNFSTCGICRFLHCWGKLYHESEANVQRFNLQLLRVYEKSRLRRLFFLWSRCNGFLILLFWIDFAKKNSKQVKLLFHNFVYRKTKWKVHEMVAIITYDFDPQKRNPKWLRIFTLQIPLQLKQWIVDHRIEKKKQCTLDAFCRNDGIQVNA